MPSLLVRFDAELRLVDDEVPEALDYATIQQAIQDAIGYTGVIVLDVTEYEQQSSDARTGDRPAGAGRPDPSANSKPTPSNDLDLELAGRPDPSTTEPQDGGTA